MDDVLGFGDPDKPGISIGLFIQFGDIFIGKPFHGLIAEKVNEILAV